MQRRIFIVLSDLRSWLSDFAAFSGRPRVTKKLNTLDMYGDLDEVELIMDVEETFGVKFESPELTNALTVGEVENLVRSKIEGRKLDLVWMLLERISRDHSRSRHGIDRNTTFLRKFAQPREVANG